MQNTPKNQGAILQAQAKTNPPGSFLPSQEVVSGTDADKFRTLTWPHALQSWWDTQLAGLSTDALHVGLELGVFAHLNVYTTVEQPAQRLALAPNNTTLLLELLWSIGILERCHVMNGALQYRLHPRLRPYLLMSSPLYCADALLFRHQVLRQAGAQLETLIRQGTLQLTTIDSTATQRGWAHAAKVQSMQKQRAVTVDVAKTILSHQPEFNRMRLMLDLGGGPGLVTIALSQLQPTLRGLVFDYPAVAEVAKENIERAGLSNRIQVRGGDLVTDDFGSGYDLIWCSSVLHFVPDISVMLNRLHTALAPKGMLVCSHAEISNDAHHAKPILQYYLNLRIQGRHVMPASWLIPSYSNLASPASSKLTMSTVR